MVHDTHLSLLKGTQWLDPGDPGPAAAVSDFLGAHPEFRPYTLPRNCMVSSVPGGILQRVR